MRGHCFQRGAQPAFAPVERDEFDLFEHRDLLGADLGQIGDLHGDGELARICKIAHNVMLGVVIQNLIEITLLVNKMGVPRHAFLAFLNNGVMGSMFTAYKSPALVNLDWTTTFTPELLRKDLDLGLELGREMDVALATTAVELDSRNSTVRLREAAIGNVIGDFFGGIATRRAPAATTLLWTQTVGLVGIVAIALFTMPADMSLRATVLGAVTGFFPIGWIVLNAIFLYDIAVDTGTLDTFKAALAALSADRRLQALLVAFSFGAFVEGAA